MPAIVFLTLFFLALLPLLVLRGRRRPPPKKPLPPGSLGVPFVGQSFGLLRALRSNTAEQWLKRRSSKYGTIFKLSLFGRNTVFLAGPGANKLVFTSGDLALQQPKSSTAIIGSRSLLELIGEEHRRVRGALMQFLKPEALRRYVGMIDAEVQHHLQMNWLGKTNVKAHPLTKGLTFDIICSLILGLERGKIREALVEDFTEMLNGVWAVPINLPFTKFGKSLRARRRAAQLISSIIRRKKTLMEQRKCSPNEDLITSLLNLGSDGNSEPLTEEEIVDNTVLVMFAGHDTSSTLLTFMIRHLANDPTNYALVLREHEDIAKAKATSEALTWDDINKMKHTWRLAMEVLRMIPPIFGNFRRALKDIEYEGFIIPKGWYFGHQAPHKWTRRSSSLRTTLILRVSRIHRAFLLTPLWRSAEEQGYAPEMSLQGLKPWL
ncbi:taxadiene 5-alpha hydroxylase-like isoform X2 [Curcuma longa]|uniref:taxadiene 5-alpha hydroxylase-like isoform X2 n=1 Tax=Curcuma longa TaxID=136217 RepID=UPI003D9E44F5